MSPSRGQAEEPVSFQNQVMAVLSKSGCNLGACHGSLSGKAGFKLSLRGQDPSADYEALVRQQFGRRTNAQDPEASLILAKPSGAMPHEGGRRFERDSVEHRLLRRWIEQGMPDDVRSAPVVTGLEVTPREAILFDPVETQALSVRATFADGSRQDVTRLAVYEPASQVATVDVEGVAHRERLGETNVVVRYLGQQCVVPLAFLPDRAAVVLADDETAHPIDRAIAEKLIRLRERPSELAADHVFLRRAYLDALGVAPTVEETEAFLHDRSPDTRVRLIEQLLERPEFAQHWALKWSDLLRNEEKQLDRKGVQALHHWIEEAIRSDTPLDAFAHALIAARGSTYLAPEANYYRALRDPYTAAEATAQLFLGVRLQCAKCHNHPFDRWSQDDYHDFAALFARVRYKILENNRRDRFDKHEFDGEQVVWMARDGEIRHPQTGKHARPRLLDGSEEPLPADADRLLALADWVTDPSNPYFARVQANRVWYHLMGRGVVDPIDDFSGSNPAINEPLLDALSEKLVEAEFRLKPLVRWIMNSRAYQRASLPNETNADDEQNFARALVRPLPAEPLLDTICAVLGTPAEFRGYPEGLRAGELPGVQAVRDREGPPSAGDQFLRVFGKPVRSLSCECERSTDVSLGQAFQMLSGPFLQELLRAPGGRLDRLAQEQTLPADAIEELYLASLCRAPSDVERAAALGYLASAADRRAALEDLTWALVSSKEFQLRW